MPLSTLQTTPRDATCKTEGQDGVAVSFLVGLFHSLQHAGLTRRSLVNASALSDARFWLSRRNRQGVLRAFDKAVRRKPTVVAADAGPTEIQ